MSTSWRAKRFAPALGRIVTTPKLAETAIWNSPSIVDNSDIGSSAVRNRG
jgi:hypothetical protein